MDEVLLTPLNQLESSLNSLLTSLTTTNSYASAPTATQSLLNADDALTSALVQLKRHQENYSHILALRAEADRLQTQLRDTVRACVDLRTEIGQIHPSILDDTDDDENEDERDLTTTTFGKLKRDIEPVDYETLLGFAARIGKHNAAAALEAERQSNRRPPDASQNKSQEANGDVSQQHDSAIKDEQPSNVTQESQAELASINDTLAQQRALRGMAFPPADVLRMGVLGRLQYLREQDSEDAVEREIERMVRESERVTTTEARVEEQQHDDNETKGVLIPERTDTASTSASVLAQPERPAPQQRPPTTAQTTLPPKPKIALDLDFPSSDEDEDD